MQHCEKCLAEPLAEDGLEVEPRWCFFLLAYSFGRTWPGLGPALDGDTRCRMTIPSLSGSEGEDGTRGFYE